MTDLNRTDVSPSVGIFDPLPPIPNETTTERLSRVLCVVRNTLDDVITLDEDGSLLENAAAMVRMARASIRAHIREIEARNARSDADLDRIAGGQT